MPTGNLEDRSLTLSESASISPRSMTSDRTLSRMEEGYPARLAGVAGAPGMLRVRGDIGTSTARRVAIVGTRRCNSYGRELAWGFGRALALAGVSVVSGGAHGVDAAAHEGALEADGHTVVVLGSGLDVTFPPDHAGLFERI